MTGLRTWRKRRITAAILRALARESAAVGAPPVFAFLPAGDELTDPGELAEGLEFFEATCADLPEVTCLSVADILLAASRGHNCCQLPEGYHWSPRAHRLGAESLAEALQAAGVVDGCAPEGRQPLGSAH